MSPAEQFHQISNDEFALFVDVARFGFRPMPIGMAAIVSGYHPRFKRSAKLFSGNANHFHGLHLKAARNYLDSKRGHFIRVASHRFISPLQSLSSASSAFLVAAHLCRSHLNPAHNYLNLKTGHFLRMP
jgi:hypothetical protein